MQSKIDALHLEILNRQLRLMRKRHLLNLWLVALLALACLVSVTWIAKIWVPDYAVRNIDYIRGTLTILIGVFSLEVYHYIAISQIDLLYNHDVKATTLLYLRVLRRRIHKKLILLLMTSLVFYLFFSAGLYLMLFHWISSRLRGGIIGGYFGGSLTLYFVFAGSVVRRFERQHQPILRLIRTLV
jgi:hypothetical protein